MNLIELIAARAAKLEEMKALNKANPKMDVTVTAEYNGLHAEFDALNREVNLLQTENILANEVDTVLTSGVDTTTNNAEYLGNILNLMAGINVDEARANMTEGVDADGGYIVPIEFQKEVIKKLTVLGETRRLSSTISTKSTKKIPIMGSVPVFTWVDEVNTYGKTKVTFDQSTLGAHKLGAIIPISKELDFDSMIELQNYLQDLMARGIDFYESQAFAVGNGVGKPTGYSVTAPVGDSSTTAAVAAVTGDEIIDIFYDLAAPYRKNATWRMTDMTEKAISKLKNTDGDYIFDKGLDSMGRSTIKSRPIVIDNDMPELGAGNKFIVLGDFSYYQIGTRGSMTVERIDNYDVDLDLDAIKAKIRVDGKLLLLEAFNSGQNAAV